MVVLLHALEGHHPVVVLDTMLVPLRAHIHHLQKSRAAQSKTEPHRTENESAAQDMTEQGSDDVQNETVTSA